jgi:GTP cyclohydrolase FolE2
MLNDVEAKEQYEVKISNRFAASENLADDDDGVDMNRSWESIRQNIKTSTTEILGYYELKQHKSSINEQCS